MGIAQVVVLGVVALCGVLGVLAHRFFGFQNILASIMMSQPLARQILKAMYTADVTKALILLFFAPFILMALSASVLNQAVRVQLRRLPMPDDQRRRSRPAVTMTNGM